MTGLIDEALAYGHGLLIVRDDPDTWHQVRRAVTAGELRRVLPGVYQPTGAAPSLRDKARALMAFDPTAVLTGRAAAWATAGRTPSRPSARRSRSVGRGRPASPSRRGACRIGS